MKNAFIKSGIISFLLLFSLSNVALANNGKPEKSKKGINFFNGTWEEALALAKKENKLIFLDAYASWCGPCRLMKARVFSKSKAGEFYNNKFINIAIDMEKGKGRTLSRQFNIRSYPTLLFINHDSKVIDYAVGYHNTRELLNFGQQVLE